MSQAMWLDSLSEDWDEEPQPSQVEVVLPQRIASSASDASHRRSSASRIPKLTKQSIMPTSDSSSLPLSERSANESNLPLSQRSMRRPSKLRNEMNLDRGRPKSRAMSASSAGSVQRHTIEQKSLSSSPQKPRYDHETPEWKRRLLNGNFAYGEQCDLFSPGGLENIFKPPPTPSAAMGTQKSQAMADSDSVMPSSPPPYITHQRPTSSSNHSNDSQRRQKTQPRMMKYRLADSDPDQFSEAELSESSCFRPGLSVSQSASQHPAIPEEQEDSLSDSVLVDNSESNKPVKAIDERSASGQSEAHNEDFSSVMLGKSSSVGGSVNYQPITKNIDQVVQSKQQQGYDQIVDDLLDSFHIDEEDSQIPVVDATSNSQDFAHNGRYVQVGRGPRAGKNHLQKRSTSASLPNIDESTLSDLSINDDQDEQSYLGGSQSDEGSEESVVQKLQVPQPLRRPTSSGGLDESSSRPSSGGSPLKLFGNYDTFTNNKLQRTLSNLESNFAGQDSDDDVFVDNSQQGMDSNAKERGKDNAQSSPHRLPPLSRGDVRPRPRVVSKFGEGDLDEFEFNEYTSQNSQNDSVFVRKEANAEDSETHGKEAVRFRFNVDHSAVFEDGSIVQRRTRAMQLRTSVNVALPRNIAGQIPPSSDDGGEVAVHVSEHVLNLETPRHHRENDIYGKRVLRSPLKDPTPKRRRTLHKTDVSYPAAEGVEAVHKSHENMQTMLGKKRKDARHGEEQRTADADVMASRQVLKPRTVSGSSRGHKSTKSAGPSLSTLEDDELYAKEQQVKLARIQAELDGLADSSMSAEGDPDMSMENGERKGSITTQDFLQDAKNVMANLRTKIHGSHLGSVEESDDKQSDVEDSIQESTMEPFERPPSREGAPLARLPQQQQDPDLLSHLQKFEDTNDIDVVLASSMKSLELMKGVVADFTAANEQVNQAITRAASRTFNLAEPFQSDPPNTQITLDPEGPHKRKQSTSATPAESTEMRFGSQDSNSSRPSTGRTNSSAVSKSSDYVKSIAPGSVSHLIPEELAGMVYDREKSTWVKRKTVSTTNFLPSDASDDDPFGDIPDLTIDETRELERIREVEARKREEARTGGIQQYTRSPQRVAREEPAISTAKIHPQNSVSMTSAETTKITNFASSGALLPGTRTTTWGSEEPLTAKQNVHPISPAFIPPATPQATTGRLGGLEEEAEEEISILDSRITTDKPRRKVTISFSSPIASIIESNNYAGDGDSMIEEVNQSKSLRAEARPLHSAKVRSSRKPSGSVRQAANAHSFVARPVSRIEERDEDREVSILERLEQNQERSVSVVITPMPSRMPSLTMVPIPVSTPSMFQRSDALLDLSPLSDFTMNPRDESLAFEVSVLHQRDQRPHQARASNGNRALTLSVKNLVQGLTDVEPYEPFWEHAKQLDLRGRRLESLHMLNEFCGRLEELNVANNEIEQLDGAPATLRRLTVSNNILSDMTSWNMFRNLQYLDVSNNGLTNLDGFKDLIHLRSLRADNNSIESLNGILGLDGLISLRLRHNDVESIDFAGSNLPNLTDLDLKDNNIQEVHNLHELIALVNLNLEDNALGEFPLNESCPAWGLKYLKLSGNRLTNLDMTNYSNLRVLYLDHNRISTITGLRYARHLDSLSLREQDLDTTLSPAIFEEAYEVRKMFLSGNFLQTFNPPVAYLNLQYLELASCGLQSLPPQFAQKTPNLRILNLNFNAVENLKPLQGIARLKVLHIAGNRLRKLHRVAQVLQSFEGLTVLDVRNNPLTQGFYPPACEKRLSLVLKEQEELDESSAGSKAEPFVMENGDVDKDQKFGKRLDLETGLKRRVYEILMASECCRLRMLDGLMLERAELGRRDRVWRELAIRGLIEMVDEDGNALVPEIQVAPETFTSSVQEGGKTAPTAVAVETTEAQYIPDITIQEPSLDPELVYEQSQDTINLMERISAVLEQNSSPRRTPTVIEPESSIWHAEDSFA